MIFIDSNIPMYLIGASHPRKSESRSLMERSIASGERMVTDVEVLQEILHRYTAIQRREAIEPAFALVIDVADQILPIDEVDVLRGKQIVLQSSQLSARDAIHIAVMERHGIQRIMSFDKGFDSWTGVTRMYAV